MAIGLGDYLGEMAEFFGIPLRERDVASRLTLAKDSGLKTSKFHGIQVWANNPPAGVSKVRNVLPWRRLLGVVTPVIGQREDLGRKHDVHSLVTVCKTLQVSCPIRGSHVRSASRPIECIDISRASISKG